MKSTINATFAIGDILFCEPIFRWVAQRDGEKPDVLIHNHLMWFKDYMPHVNFVSNVFMPACEYVTKDHGPNLVNLRYANQIMRGLAMHDHSDFENCMLDKYRMMGLPEFAWKSLRVEFNQDRGEALMKALGLFPLESYILINEHCQAGHVNIDPDARGKREVRMSNIPGFTVLDWWLVIKQADAIHTVSTSLFYIFQALCNQGWLPPEIFIYPRPNEDGLRGISQLVPDFDFIKVEK